MWFLLSVAAILSPRHPFEQIDGLVPFPNNMRLASGAPGHQYWQQRADYTIEIDLDVEQRTIKGRQTLTYSNRAPHDLDYLWIQLDQNRLAPDSLDRLSRTGTVEDKTYLFNLERTLPAKPGFGFIIEHVRDSQGRDLSFNIVDSLMRVNLGVESMAQVSLSMAWTYQIAPTIDGDLRHGFEYLNDGLIFQIAQFHPRMAAYYDQTGWQIQPFLGDGEFALEFGDFDVRINLAANYLVAATGTLQNGHDVLSSSQRRRLEQAAQAQSPVVIARPDEYNGQKGQKTWHFKAKNVRDFAFACSSQFIWDAQGTTCGDQPVMAMSFYPQEANPLWGQYATAAVIHTLDVYGKHTFDYPYPVAINVNGAVSGMEYPMMSFVGARPSEDGTYSQEVKHELISITIHEVGHNFFPMLVNSDERWWTWMDEGINSFLQTLAEEAWQEDYPHRRGEPKDIVQLMAARKGQVPIMTRSDSLLRFSENAYFKASVALLILRESVLGRERFDDAFRQYARRWMFKRPTPADFFRTMEDASGVDLDWFWNGWFFSTAHCDQAIESVTERVLDSRDPEIEKPREKNKREKDADTAFRRRNREQPRRVEQDPRLQDFYDDHDPWLVTDRDRAAFERYRSELNEDERAFLNSGYRFFEVSISNRGGLVMPVILKVRFEDQSEKLFRLPAEIWRFNTEQVTRVVVTKKQPIDFELDPLRETADVDRHNNVYRGRIASTRFRLHPIPYEPMNPMQRDQ